MRACGLIAEYNPLHNGHIHHIKAARQISQADCIIAVMSGSFLQRGEPAIIDKFHRAKMALAAGVDLVLELPFAYAVQSSELFSKGAVRTLDEMGVTSMCFGSESGQITDFLTSYALLTEQKRLYEKTLHKKLEMGLAFPHASMLAYEHIGLTADRLDLSLPNNILGFSYISEIMNHDLPITPLTIKRTQNHYHDQTITGSIASATSIREKIIQEKHLTKEVLLAMPEASSKQLRTYLQTTQTMHTWEAYFPFLHYRIMTMSLNELQQIDGVTEGLEYRIKDKARHAKSFKHLIGMIKTKRYTYTRLQRIFTAILTNTTATEISTITAQHSVPYVRLLGFTPAGRAYLRQQKKQLAVPLLSQLNRRQIPALALEERATDAYYSILKPNDRHILRQQELSPPLMMT